MSLQSADHATRRCGTCRWFAHESSHWLTRCRLAAAMPSVNRVQGVAEHHGMDCPAWSSLTPEVEKS